MTYLLRSKPKSRYPWKILSVVALFLFLSFMFFIVPSFLKGVSFVVARPVWSVASVVTRPFGGFLGYFSTKNSLIEKNMALQDEIAMLRLKEIDYDLVAKENQDLKSELGRVGQSKKVLGKILSKPPKSPYDTFVIDIGTNEGLLPSQKVYASANILIGVVSNVTQKTSLVRLFSSGEEKLEALVSRTGDSLILNGEGGGNFQVEVPKDTDIVVGDSLVYPGNSEAILAMVHYIDMNSQSSFKTVYLKIPGNVFGSKYVFVETLR